MPIREASPAAPGQPLPQRLLILDTETTGLDPQRDRCIELGAVLFDLPRRSVLSQVSLLLPCDQNAAQAVNGIDPELTQQPQPWQQGLQWFEALLASADLVVAHNAAFDRQWFGIEPLPAIHKPWLCTMEDIRWPADRNLRSNPSVRDLALAYSVPVWAAHRALTDCIYLAQVFERCDDLEQLVQQGLEPRRLYRARLSYEERHRARDAGFRWNEPVSGAWSRRLSEREAALLPFPVVPVDGDQQRRSA
jgi:DNA polymerase-3 subunit epsilon